MCIRDSFSRVDPQGLHVVPFKKPTPEELDHDFLLFFLKIIIVVTNIIHNRLMGQVKNPCSGLIDKITVMRNIKDGSTVAV